MSVCVCVCVCTRARAVAESCQSVNVSVHAFLYTSYICLMCATELSPGRYVSLSVARVMAPFLRFVELKTDAWSLRTVLIPVSRHL